MYVAAMATTDSKQIARPMYIRTLWNLVGVCAHDDDGGGGGPGLDVEQPRDDALQLTLSLAQVVHQLWRGGGSMLGVLVSPHWKVP